MLKERKGVKVKCEVVCSEIKKEWGKNRKKIEKARNQSGKCE